MRRQVGERGCLGCAGKFYDKGRLRAVGSPGGAQARRGSAMTGYRLGSIRMDDMLTEKESASHVGLGLAAFRAAVRRGDAPPGQTKTPNGWRRWAVADLLPLEVAVMLAKVSPQKNRKAKYEREAEKLREAAEKFLSHERNGKMRTQLEDGSGSFERVACMVLETSRPRRMTESAGAQVHNLVRQKMVALQVNYARALELVRTDPGNRDLMKAFNEETIRGGRG